MIKAFKDAETERFWNTGKSSVFPPDIQKRAMSKLLMLDAANSLGVIASVPGNNFEKLAGNLAGYYSVRVNKQWRVIFQWFGNDAYSVSVTDYH